MRISDWSSDVCSSDLRALVKFAELDGADRLLGQGFLRFDMRDPTKLVARKPGEVVRHDVAPAASPGPIADRKSVVTGKSVSVRVDLGGRRIIKKKTRKIKRA